MSSHRSRSDDPRERSSELGRLHEGLRAWIRSRGWYGLREVQERAIPLLLDTERDVVIVAPTAGGKTEAAFLPVLTRVARRSTSGFSVLCLSPLKALINDQHRRLEPMADAVRVRAHRWHGDVARSLKSKALRHPQGVLSITPESLEALFVRRGPELGRLFSGLTHVVIDELHLFIESERGRQVQSLLHRLELLVRRRIPRVGLSATIGDVSIAAEYLRPGRGETVARIESAAGGGQVLLQVRAYEDADPDDDHEPPDGEAVPAIAEHVFAVSHRARVLVFANRKSTVESYADTLRRRSEDRRLPNAFFPHHGSLSKALREDAERKLKSGERPVNAVCTSTLELGIDIGAIESVAQIGCPPSVASIRQRLGRSGRRGRPATLRIYVTEAATGARSTVLDSLRLELFRTAAMVNLLVERWCEPPSRGQLHLSTLIQQVLSVTAQLGGARADAIYRALCASGPFDAVDAATFVALLRSLGRHGLLMQSTDGALLPGERGERLINHPDFYSTFRTDDEYSVQHAGRRLGSIPVYCAVLPGNMIVFAGRRWTVVDVDVDRKRVSVNPAKRGKPPKYGGSGARVHDRVRREMRRLYLSGEVPRFLDAEAVRLLEQGRVRFRASRLDARSIVPDGHDCYVFAWCGDRVVDTLAAMLREHEVCTGIHDGVLVCRDTSPDALVETFVRLTKSPAVDPVRLAKVVPNKTRHKYDRFLTEDLRRADHAAREIDAPGALQVARELVDGCRRQSGT